MTRPQNDVYIPSMPVLPIPALPISGVVSDLAGWLERLPSLLGGWAAPRPCSTLLPAGDEDWAALAQSAPDGGILLILSPVDLESILRLSFVALDCYRLRAVDGLLLAGKPHAGARIARLTQDLSAGAFLYVVSDQTPPPLPQGLLESASPVAASVFAVAPAVAPPAASSRLIALAERLMVMEENLVEAKIRVTLLESRLSQSWSDPVAQSGGGYFDVPRERHEWRLAGSGSVEPAQLGLYDRRVDDAVILAARAGDIFCGQFQLYDDIPDYFGAAQFLAGIRNDSAPALPPAPAVSIVVPVYGQLTYTLNCLHSLLLHQSKYDFEILIVDDGGTDQTAAILPLIPQIRYHRCRQNKGFIAAANEGAKLARGAFLVMLNNDTRVVDGWLDGLIDGFSLFPKAGLVGSKLHYEDGSLQESGGIIWRDGSCWNYGCRDDPNRPQYSYARQVDYISGCSIALKASVWREMGGFDTYYTPAYCEDADLCLRLVQHGYEIWFQPASRVVHYEGKTSGTDTSKGVKAYQIVNTNKLYLRWREKLLDHRANAVAPYFERERLVKRRMLVVDAVTPTPKQDAGSVQTVMAIQAGIDLGYKVHFVPEDNFLFDSDATQALQAMGVDCAYAPYEVGFDNYIRRYGFLFDVVLVYRVTILDRTIDLIETCAPQATLLFHVADLHHLRMRREADLESDLSLWEQAEKTAQREFALAARAHGTITHSTHEARLLAESVPDANVIVWPLMFETAGTNVGYAPRREIVFLGGYRHSPNVDAVRYFLDEIWPLVKRTLKDVRFIIAGANPTQAVLEMAADDVIVTGQIDDLRDLFDQTRVFVAPLRVGAGVKGKVMSALAYGVPVVATAVALEGSGLIADEHVLQADTPADFAAQIIRIYQDENLWCDLSTAGLSVMRQHYSPAQGRDFLARAIDRATYRRLEVPFPDGRA